MDYMEMEMARVNGLAHGNIHVRSTMLHTFSRDAWIPVEALGIVMEQVDRYGWEGSYTFPHTISHFPHSPESPEWVLGKIFSEEHAQPDGDRTPMQTHLLRWLEEATAEWLADRIGELRSGLPALPVFRSGYGAEVVGAFLRQADRRIAALSMPGEELREKIAEVVAECAEMDEFPREEIKGLEALCEAAAGKRVFTDDELAAWLEMPFDEESDEDDFISGYFASAALLVLAARGGSLSEGMVKKIVCLFGIDWDWTNELIARALERTADRESLAELLRMYPVQDWHGRLYLSGVFEEVRIPGFEGDFQAAYKREKDLELKTTFAMALALHGTEGALETVRQHLRKHGDYSECGPLRDLVFCQEIVQGKESDAAGRHLLRMEEERARIDKAMAQMGMSLPRFGPDTRLLDKLMGEPLPVTPAKAAPTVGRNEPCPCGSGKKFKKCCGK